jgi:hypothetical protein
VFGLLNDAAAAFVDRHAIPAATKLTSLYGPARSYTAPVNNVRSTSLPWSAFSQAIRDTASFYRTAHRLPDEVWIGSESMAPADYLATLAHVVEELIASGKAPTAVTRYEGRFTADRYVAEDSPKLWNWVIFPEGFHAPKIIELARLQAWTLKPALLQH